MKKILALLVAVMVLAASMTIAIAEAPSMDAYVQNILFTNGDKDNTVIMVPLLTAALNESNEMTYTATSYCPAAYNTPELIEAALSDGDAITAMANAIGAARGATSPTAEDVLSEVFGSNGQATINDVPAGWYYAIVQGTSDSGVVYKNMLINTTPIPNGASDWQKALNGTAVATDATATVEVKKTTETITKGVGEIPDHTAPIDTDNAYSVGDTVPFEIKTTIPNYPSDSTAAKFIITDTPQYLTDNLVSVTVYVGGTEDSNIVTACDNLSADDATFTKGSYAEGKGFILTFASSYILLHPGQAVTVQYDATIDESAVITEAGLTANNTATIQFNPNPYIDQGVEPGDTTQLYTYGVYVEKQDGNSQPLEGAVIGLYSDANCTAEVARATTAIATYEGNDGKAYVSFKGLEAGTYYLKEITPPSGYKQNTTVFTVQVDATHTGENDPLTLAEETNFNHPAGTPIINTPGSTLPSTGGIGTTIFYVGGGLLVLLAVVFLVTKRRMNTND